MINGMMAMMKRAEYGITVFTMNINGRVVKVWTFTVDILHNLSILVITCFNTKYKK